MPIEPLRSAERCGVGPASPRQPTILADADKLEREVDAHKEEAYEHEEASAERAHDAD